jgi:hypothetical protein
MLSIDTNIVICVDTNDSEKSKIVQKMVESKTLIIQLFGEILIKEPTSGAKRRVV